MYFLNKANSIVGFGTGWQLLVLERRPNPKLSRRTCTCEYGLHSCRGKSAGVAKRPRERSPTRNPSRYDSQLVHRVAIVGRARSADLRELIPYSHRRSMWGVQRSTLRRVWWRSAPPPGTCSSPRPTAPTPRTTSPCSSPPPPPLPPLQVGWRRETLLDLKDPVASSASTSAVGGRGVAAQSDRNPHRHLILDIKDPGRLCLLPS
jgi:hypothetical protein